MSICRTLVAAAAVAVVALRGTLRRAAQSGNPCAPPVQPDRLRELQARHPARQWEIFRAGDENIQGFATR